MINFYLSIEGLNSFKHTDVGMLGWQSSFKASSEELNVSVVLFGTLTLTLELEEEP